MLEPILQGIVLIRLPSGYTNKYKILSPRLTSEVMYIRNVLVANYQYELYNVNRHNIGNIDIYS